jgi:heat shock protein HslJ
VHLAVSRFAEGGVDNFATVLLGDRVMVRGINIENGSVVVDMIQAGRDDGACCAGDVVTRAWHLQEGKLAEVDMHGETERFSVETIGGVEWVLSRWGHDEPVEDVVRITLSYADGKFSGSTSCNRYFAGVSVGDEIAGSISVGAMGSTRMACADERFAIAESRFLKALEQVGRITFLAGELVLNWGQGSDFGALYFKRNKPDAG